MNSELKEAIIMLIEKMEEIEMKIDHLMAVIDPRPISQHAIDGDGLNALISDPPFDWTGVIIPDPAPPLRSCSQ